MTTVAAIFLTLVMMATGRGATTAPHSDDPILVPPQFIAVIDDVTVNEDGELVWVVLIYRIDVQTGEAELDGEVTPLIDDYDLLLDCFENPGGEADEPSEEVAGDPVSPSVKGRLKCRKCSNTQCCGNESTTCGNSYRYIRRNGQYKCMKKCAGDINESSCP